MKKPSTIMAASACFTTTAPGEPGHSPSLGERPRSNDAGSLAVTHTATAKMNPDAPEANGVGAVFSWYLRRLTADRFANRNSSYRPGSDLGLGSGRAGRARRSGRHASDGSSSGQPRSADCRCGAQRSGEIRHSGHLRPERLSVPETTAAAGATSSSPTGQGSARPADPARDRRCFDGAAGRGGAPAPAGNRFSGCRCLACARPLLVAVVGRAGANGPAEGGGTDAGH